MAIDIFRILSRNHESVKDVPARALSHLSSKNISYETLLQKVSQKQIELDQLLNNNRQLEVELRNQKGAMEGVLNLRLQDEVARAKRELERIMSEARNLVEEARRNEITKTRKVDEKAYQLKAEIEKLRGEEVPKEEIPQLGTLTLDQVKAGDTVYSHVLKKDLVVHAVDLRKQEVMVAKGAFKLNVPISTLSKNRNAPKGPEVRVSFQKSSHAQFEIDARGMRLSEFQNRVELALGDLLTGDVPFLNIVHGHGDGILKKWLRDYLKRSKDFKGDIPENGNDGETKVSLR